MFAQILNGILLLVVFSSDFLFHAGVLRLRIHLTLKDKNNLANEQVSGKRKGENAILGKRGNQGIGEWE
jgi:hypothetical protein